MVDAGRASRCSEERAQPLYICFPMGAVSGNRAVSTGEPARRLQLRTGRSQWERRALDRSKRPVGLRSLLRQALNG